MNISSLKYHVSDIKAENSSTLSNFHEWRKGLPPMGSNADLILILSRPPRSCWATGPSDPGSEKPAC